MLLVSCWWTLFLDESGVLSYCRVKVLSFNSLVTILLIPLLGHRYILMTDFSAFPILFFIFVFFGGFFSDASTSAWFCPVLGSCCLLQYLSVVFSKVYRVLVECRFWEMWVFGSDGWIYRVTVIFLDLTSNCFLLNMVFGGISLFSPLRVACLSYLKSVYRFN